MAKVIKKLEIRRSWSNKIKICCDLESLKDEGDLYIVDPNSGKIYRLTKNGDMELVEL